VPTGLSAPPTASMNPSWDSHSQRLLIDRLVIRPSTRATHHEQVANARAHATDRGPMRVTCRICRTVLLSTRPNWRMLKDQVLLSRPREASFAGVLTRCPHGRLDRAIAVTVQLADSTPAAARAARRPWPCSPSGRCTATRSCRNSVSAAVAAGARAPVSVYPTLQQLEDEVSSRWRTATDTGHST